LISLQESELRQIIKEEGNQSVKWRQGKKNRDLEDKELKAN